MTTHLVQFSTGVGSAEVLRRVAAEHGRDVVALTADVLTEDEDNWRFAREVIRLVGCRWIVLADGRTPMQVGRDLRVVPNNRMAVCSRVLKRELLRKFMDDTYDPADSIVYLGHDWTEGHRHDRAVEPWKPWTIQSPLMGPPYRTKEQLLDGFRGLGIEPPRLYAQGFGHANCGGACVRGGQAEWARLLFVNRRRYLEWEAEEEESRAMLDKDVTILRDRAGGVTKPLSLRQFRERLDVQPSMFDAEDVGACGCTDDAVAS